MRYMLFTVLLLYSAHLGCKKALDGVSFTLCRFEMGPNAHWEVGDTNENVCPLLQQSFTYLGRGGQSYVFASSDGQYVLKLFRIRYHAPFPWLSTLSFLQKQIDKREKKYLRDFSSYALAYNALKRESGLIYMHLNPSTHLPHRVVLIDKIGSHHCLDLNQFAFALQQRAIPAAKHLRELLETGNVYETKEAIRKALSLISLRCRMGISDEDPRVDQNMGFLDGEPLFIDLGRFKKGPINEAAEIAKATKRLKTTMTKDALSLIEEVENEMAP